MLEIAVIVFLAPTDSTLLASCLLQTFTGPTIVLSMFMWAIIFFHHSVVSLNQAHINMYSIQLYVYRRTATVP
jgi:hypothetical protein